MSLGSASSREEELAGSDSFYRQGKTQDFSLFVPVGVIEAAWKRLIGCPGMSGTAQKLRAPKKGCFCLVLHHTFPTLG